MLHHNRHWFVSTVDTAQALAELLTKSTWTLCTGFVLQDHERYLFVNDSTSPDGAQEYAVLFDNGGTIRQIESITFGWCNADRAQTLIDEVLNGSFDHCDYGAVEVGRVQRESVEATHRCAHCA